MRARRRRNADRAHCTLIPANLTTSPHFAVSAAMNCLNAIGVMGSGTAPRAAMRATSVGSDSPALTALLTMSMTFAGVPASAPMPSQTGRLVTGQELGQRRNVRQHLQALFGRHTERAQLAGFDVADHRRHRLESELHPAAEQIGKYAFPCRAREQGLRQPSSETERENVRQAAVTGRAKEHIAGIGFGISERNSRPSSPAATG